MEEQQGAWGEPRAALRSLDGAAQVGFARSETCGTRSVWQTFPRPRCLGAPAVAVRCVGFG